MSRFLTRHEKAVELASYLALLAKESPSAEHVGGHGYSDSAMFPYIARLNTIPDVLTLQSCAGHRVADDHEYTASLWLRLDESLASVFYDRAVELDGFDYIERVSIFWLGGREIVDISCVGLNRLHTLEPSVGRIVGWLERLAEEPR